MGIDSDTDHRKEHTMNTSPVILKRTESDKALDDLLSAIRHAERVFKDEGISHLDIARDISACRKIVAGLYNQLPESLVDEINRENER